MIRDHRTLPLPSDRMRGTLARVRDDTELADLLLRQRLTERLFGAAAPAPRIAGYTLERRVGEGGMGVVYRAHDAELDRPVALKLMHPELGGAAERIRGEARALARLAHPNVVSVHEIGEHEGRLFVAMEFVEGETLRAWVERRRGAWRPGNVRGLGELLAVFMQAAHGLWAAHTAGLVHRDFKPDNVLVGVDGRVRVVDFGIASQVGAAAAEVEQTADLVAPMRTRTGEMLGTPAYMAPEQFVGAPVDARTDQFALCVALYEAICGVRPFAGGTVQALMQAVVAGEVRAPPRWLPARVREALGRGLQRDPARRFRDMGELIAALGGGGSGGFGARWGMVTVSAIGLVVLGSLVAGYVSSSRGDGARDMSQGAGPTGVKDMSQGVGGDGAKDMSQGAGVVAAECRPEPPVADMARHQARLTALVPQGRALPEGSAERRAIEAEMAAGMVVIEEDRAFACKWTRELLTTTAEGATRDRLACLLRQHCEGPATVVCPPGLHNTTPHGCEASAGCGVSGVAEQTAACVERGDAACCQSVLIIREYEMLEGGVAEKAESRAELGKLAARACASGVAQACTQAVQLGVEGKDELLRRGCALGRVAACEARVEETR